MRIEAEANEGNLNASVMLMCRMQSCEISFYIQWDGTVAPFSCMGEKLMD